jgi:hypothetical protein
MRGGGSQRPAPLTIVAAALPRPREAADLFASQAQRIAPELEVGESAGS